MKKLIQFHKDVSGIIQHGTYSLQEIKPDVLSLAWDYDGQKIQAVFNQSTKNYLVEDSDAVALASHYQELEQQLVILPKGFVVF